MNTPTSIVLRGDILNCGPTFRNMTAGEIVAELLAAHKLFDAMRSLSLPTPEPPRLHADHRLRRNPDLKLPRFHPPQ